MAEHEGEGERRHQVRVRYPCEAHAYGVGERLQAPHLADLSAEGAFIETASELPLGTIVILRFHAAGHDLKLEGEVVRGVAPRGLGVHFVRLTPGDRAALEHIVSEAAVHR